MRAAPQENGQTIGELIQASLDDAKISMGESFIAMNIVAVLEKYLKMSNNVNLGEFFSILDEIKSECDWAKSNLERVFQIDLEDPMISLSLKAVCVTLIGLKKAYGEGFCTQHALDALKKLPDWANLIKQDILRSVNGGV